jgi:hypothetical protein
MSVTIITTAWCSERHPVAPHVKVVCRTMAPKVAVMHNITLHQTYKCHAEYKYHEATSLVLHRKVDIARCTACIENDVCTGSYVRLVDISHRAFHIRNALPSRVCVSDNYFRKRRSDETYVSVRRDSVSASASECHARASNIASRARIKHCIEHLYICWCITLLARAPK